MMQGTCEAAGAGGVADNVRDTFPVRRYPLNPAHDPAHGSEAIFETYDWAGNTNIVW